MKKKNFLYFLTIINYFFIFLSLFLLLYTFYQAQIVHEAKQLKYYLKYYILFSSSLIMWIYVTTIKTDSRIVFLMTGSLLIITLYTFEIIKFYNISINNLLTEKKKIIVVKNEKLVLLEKLRETNKDTYPSIIPNIFLDKNEIEIYPLSGISNVKTIFCKEGPEYAIYQSDRYGFNNPDNQWSNNLDYVLIGDSFAQGACVKEGQDIASHLRKLTNKNILTLGMAGNGPLTELASLKEYISDKKVKNIFWIYFERNDLKDLKKEKKNKILVKYLKKNFSQNLNKKQNKIDSLVKEVIFDQEKKLKINNFEEKIYKKLVFQKIIRLQIVRDKTAFDRGLNFGVDPLFEEIILKAKRFAEVKNSKFYFIYLPDKQSFTKNNVNKKNFLNKQEVLEIIKRNNIDTIDINSTLFLKEKDPFALFAHRIYGHYSADTYFKIAEIIKNHIEQYP